MKSHNHHLAFLCASILLFVLAIVAIPASAQSGGLDVLSLSRCDYSWSGELQENAWNLYIAQSSSGEHIYGAINRKGIKGIDPMTGEEGFATHDIEIIMNTLETTCEYQIQPIWNIDIKTASVYVVQCKGLQGDKCDWYGEELSSQGWFDRCREETGRYDSPYWNDGGYFGSKILACVFEESKATHAEIGDPVFNFKTELLLHKLGERGQIEDTIRTVISNQEGKSAKLGSVGHVEWKGNLVSGVSCPVRNLPNAVYDSSTGRYTLVSNDDYEMYRNYYNLEWRRCLEEFRTTNADSAESHIRECVETLNIKANNALREETIVKPPLREAHVEGNIVKAKIQSDAYIPTYSLILSGSWIGIYVPKPKPEVRNIRTEWNTKKSQGKVYAEIKNIGDEGGSFTYGITCDSPAQVVVNLERSDYWNKGQVKTVEFSVTGTVSKETIATCTVYVYDTKYPDIRVEKTETITIPPIPTPKPTKPIPTSTSTGAPPPSIIPPPDGGASTFLPYGIIGLVFIGIIVMAFLWRRSGTKVPAPAPPEPVAVEAKRPSSAKWVVAIIIILLILALGLFVVTSLKQPEVSLKSVSVKGFESINLLIVEIPTEVIFSVVLEVYNPNFLGATVTDVEYDLYVNDVYVGKGSLPRAVTIPANDKTNVETEVSVSVSSSIQALITAIQQGSATAKVNGNVYIGAPIRGSISVPFSEEQRLV